MVFLDVSGRRPGHLKGQVGDVDELIVHERQQVEEAELGESARLDLFHAVVVDQELLERRQPIKRLLEQRHRFVEKSRGGKKSVGNLTAGL